MIITVEDTVTPTRNTLLYNFTPPFDLGDTQCLARVYQWTCKPGRRYQVTTSNQAMNLSVARYGLVTGTNNQFRATYTPSGGSASTQISSTFPSTYYTPAEVISLMNSRLNTMFGVGKVVASLVADANGYLNKVKLTCPTAGDVVTIDSTYELGTSLGWPTTPTAANSITAPNSLTFTITYTLPNLPTKSTTSLQNISSAFNSYFSSRTGWWVAGILASVLNNNQLQLTGSSDTRFTLVLTNSIWSSLGMTATAEQTKLSVIQDITPVETFNTLEASWLQPRSWKNSDPTQNKFLCTGPSPTGGPCEVYIPSGEHTVTFTVGNLLTVGATYDVYFAIRLVSRDQ